MLAEKDAVAVALFNKYNKVKMPNLHLAPMDVKTLLDYFEARTAAAAQAVDSSEKAEPDSNNQGPGRN
jgi:protein SCO1/2